MGRTEHILLESDDREVPQLSVARKIHAKVQLRSRLRRRMLQLHIIDYYYLAVRSARRRSAVVDYVLDLRFVEPSLRLSRRVAWRWMTVSLVLAAVAAGIGWRIGSSAAPWWRHEWLAAFLVTATSAMLAALICLYRSTETLALFSVHGKAKLLEFSGSLGTFRGAQRFATTLAAHIRLAAAARRASVSEHLRDEMREHFRLKEATVLSAEEYEAGKVRILAHH